ncbi:glutamate-1-semialdehyde 2,1-aminomutase [Pseudorhodoplanes sp.]|uniref:glutamate-1-semialdehyde 2,1-aminomutase n=1 Tax=Pseudorhodoplanes sp. TaxID=1934341 RepID=UPI002B9E71D3|nr:glutamate-1-semialdehyde 2,1-aminomutase [Pseudorhodoplanes sp.]HWV43646.1 glutamate-1-semialdehyde 2,1-aminomutase [Pseudorhodoplanes sp.]
MAASSVLHVKKPAARLGGTTFDNGRKLSRRAHELIPGGAHTYAKGDDQYPELAPGFIARGKGSHVWDLDGNEYIEYGMGLRSVTLGHAYRPVMEAAIEQMQYGTNFVRPAPIEVECAECFLELVPTAEMVKFGKHGSDALDGAVRLARAHTGRDHVAICNDHPFFSVSDWFIGATPMPGGIPQRTRAYTLGFRYNDLQSVAALFESHPDQIACVVLEPARLDEPEPGFLSSLKDLCHRNGALLVFDEMLTGFRWHKSGAQHIYGVTPDLSCFGKAMGNGYALSALAGKREIMQLGGYEHDRERVFLLSTTHGAETHALAAGIATMKTYRDQDVVGHLYRQGRKLREGVTAAARDAGVADQVQCLGRDCALLFTTRDADGNPSQEFRALFMQEMIRRGVLAPSFVISYSHTDADVAHTIEATAEALRIYRKALEGNVRDYLVGRPLKPVFRPYG